MIFQCHPSLDDESEKEGDLLVRHKPKIARAIGLKNGDDERALVIVDVAGAESIAFGKLNPLKELVLCEKCEGEVGCGKEDLRGKKDSVTFRFLCTCRVSEATGRKYGARTINAEDTPFT